MAVRLRIRLPSGNSTLTAVTVRELSDHIDDALGPNVGWTLLSGYPPAPTELPASDEQLSTFLNSGDTVVVRQSSAPPPLAPATAPTLSQEDEEMRLAMALSLGQAPPVESRAPPLAADGGERLVRRVIPADNSCLFAAVAHATQGSAGRRQRADKLRQVVSDAVLADGEQFSEAMLGRPPAEYASWVLQQDSWGGGIELAILSNHFGIEIAAFDIQTKRVDRFGMDGGYATRAMLLYDGIHYDLIVKQLVSGASEELDVSIFDATDDAAMVEAERLVAEQHKARKFTDTSKFTLRCLVCQSGLVGEAGALEHAKKTGHANFCEFR